MQRRKGAQGERELAGILSDALGQVVKRRLGQAREGGCDIAVGKFVIEVKRHEENLTTILKWCAQAEEAAIELDEINKPTPVPVLAFRRSGDVWRVVLRLDDFLPLMRGELTDPLKAWE